MNRIQLKKGTVVRALKHFEVGARIIVTPGMIGIIVEDSKVRWLTGSTCTVFEDEVQELP